MPAGVRLELAGDALRVSGTDLYLFAGRGQTSSGLPAPGGHGGDLVAGVGPHRLLEAAVSPGAAGCRLRWHGHDQPRPPGGGGLSASAAGRLAAPQPDGDTSAAGLPGLRPAIG